MISTKKHIRQLAAILLARGIGDIIISPGSRNGPLIHTFAGCGRFQCRNIVDERSAAYFALGLAQSTQKPVVLVCTSGTAALNYSSGIAEAFYLNLPLIVLTADRPPWWIGQAESQCIRQDHIYKEFTKKEVTLPVGESEKELWFAGRLINECLNMAVSGTKGPVHINIPVEEPLHDLLDEELPAVQVIQTTALQPTLTETELDRLASVFNGTGRVMILAGQQFPDTELESLLSALSEKTGTVILKEHLANLNHQTFCGSIDLLMSALKNDRMEDFRPELLITFAGQFVSKPLKQFLRNNKPFDHWHLTLSDEHVDTYHSLTRVINQNATLFFKQLLSRIVLKNKTYLNRWKEKEQQVNQRRDQFIAQTEFCDLKAFSLIAHAIPENPVVHLGNSSPVRYALILDAVKGALYLGNRGTAGIDGSLSTTVGFASVSEKLNTIIIGDLSFFYDSNGLWNNYIGKNLRVIVINNRGGNIFSMIKGPEKSPAFSEHFFTENKIRAEGIAKTFGLSYYHAGNEEELKAALGHFYSPRQEQAALLEIFTDAPLNSRIFRGLFKAMSDEL
ncbi:MAG: 2-succinyl-5-enolpyruvyl-6-hydroxy-3-cyclohexene-1-carboxylic-acid synthase [Prolixibacteraceae bacterium]